MQGAYLGISYSNDEVKASLDSLGAHYEYLEDANLLERTAQILANESVVGWFQGRMEFGPRALGGRSILGDARSEKMQSVMNLKIKHRESFRPFAPSVLEESAADYFELESPSPYMLIVAPLIPSVRLPMTEAQSQLFGIHKLNVPRSSVPAITHIDYSARVQTVSASRAPRYHALLQAFADQTGCSMLVNTSFNVRGEPIVCSPEDAYRCFMRTEMDYLVIENYLLSKADQMAVEADDRWKDDFTLD